MSLGGLRIRDEVLQAMYWMLGEEIAHEVDAAYVARFLAEPADDIAGALATLVRERLVLRGAREGGYRLSREGIAEGARRFHDEFGDITRQAHGECAPGCTCHTEEGEGKPCPSTVGAGAAGA